MVEKLDKVAKQICRDLDMMVAKESAMAIRTQYMELREEIGRIRSSLASSDDDETTRVDISQYIDVLEAMKRVEGG